MKKNLFIKSNKICSESPPKNQLIGLKAAGLSNVPNSWIPPYFVISTKFYEELEFNTGFKNIKIISEYILDNYLETISKYLAKTIKPEQKKLIIRSSSTHESILVRGRYDSQIITNDPNILINKISRLYRKWDSLKQHQDEKFSAIIQQYINPESKGHLSNERRISKLTRDWYIEYEPDDKILTSTIYTFKIFKHRIDDENLPEELISNKFTDINNALHMPAQKATFSQERIHFEWVWGKNKVWIVQADNDKTPKGSNPRETCLTEIGKFTHFEPNTIREICESDGLRWQKAENVIELKKAGLPTTKLWVLDDVNQIKNLSTNYISEELEFDIDKLTSLPVVIRTDLDKGKPQSKRQMLPRTHTLHSPDEVINFLIETSKLLVGRKVGVNNICFLFHHFIPSTSSAYCFAKPNDGRVRVDSIWGLPDGLSYYPHDSAELDVIKPDIIEKKPRWKELYLFPEKNGNWSPKLTGDPWDWTFSVGNKNIKDIAIKTKLFADYVNSPVRLMWFVDIPPLTGHPKNLPWYYELEDVPKSIRQNIGYTNFSKSDFVINTISDIEKGYKELESNTNFQQIRLQPSPEYIRNETFLLKISDLAKKFNLPIVLHGSVLQHAYYQLKNHSVNVLIHDPFDIEHNNQQFQKLVRDKIPEQIQDKGESVESEVLSGDKLEEYIKEKIMEEAQEVYWSSDNEEVIEELGDLIEISLALASHRQIDSREIKRRRTDKAKNRGAFEKGVILKSTKGKPLIEIENAPPKQSKTTKKKSQGSTNQIDIKTFPPIDKEPTIHYLKKLGISLIVRFQRDVITLEVRGPMPTKKSDMTKEVIQLKLPFI